MKMMMTNKTVTWILKVMARKVLRIKTLVIEKISKFKSDEFLTFYVGNLHCNTMCHKSKKLFRRLYA